MCLALKVQLFVWLWSGLISPYVCLWPGLFSHSVFNTPLLWPSHSIEDSLNLQQSESGNVYSSENILSANEPLPSGLFIPLEHLQREFLNPPIPTRSFAMNAYHNNSSSNINNKHFINSQHVKLKSHKNLLNPHQLSVQARSNFGSNGLFMKNENKPHFKIRPEEHRFHENDFIGKYNDYEFTRHLTKQREDNDDDLFTIRQSYTTRPINRLPNKNAPNTKKNNNEQSFKNQKKNPFGKNDEITNSKVLEAQISQAEMDNFENINKDNQIYPLKTSRHTIADPNGDLTVVTETIYKNAYKNSVNSDSETKKFILSNASNANYFRLKDQPNQDNLINNESDIENTLNNETLNHYPVIPENLLNSFKQGNYFLPNENPNLNTDQFQETGDVKYDDKQTSFAVKDISTPWNSLKVLPVLQDGEQQTNLNSIRIQNETNEPYFNNSDDGLNMTENRQLDNNLGILAISVIVIASLIAALLFTGSSVYLMYKVSNIKKKKLMNIRQSGSSQFESGISAKDDIQEFSSDNSQANSNSIKTRRSSNVGSGLLSNNNFIRKQKESIVNQPLSSNLKANTLIKSHIKPCRSGLCRTEKTLGNKFENITTLKTTSNQKHSVLSRFLSKNDFQNNFNKNNNSGHCVPIPPELPSTRVSFEL